MTKVLGPREKFLALNGLVCLVQSLEGKYTIVDLRNETSVYGKLEDVDVFMNISMSNAVFTNSKGERYKFDNFFIQARNIRYVHIPEQVPIIKAVEQQIGRVLNPGRGKQSKEMGKSLKTRRAIRKQKETLDMIEKLKEERLAKERSN